MFRYNPFSQQLDWISSEQTASLSTPGGNDTEIQFNDGGVLNGDSHFTYNKTTDTAHIHIIAGDATDGLIITSANGTQVGIFGAANTANVTWAGSHNFTAATQDTIAAFTGAGKTLGSLALATYPSLTELSYVKGLTSSAQTQITAKTTLAAVNAQNLSVFASTTSAQLAGIISDETGSGALVFANTPTLVTPVLGVASATSVSVGDDAYASGWNASTLVPTKNAIWDKIEAMTRQRIWIYTTTGANTWNKPTDANFKGVLVWVVAGGGGGGGAGTNSTIGGGGGGGAAAFKSILAASLGSTETATVGIAGTAGASGNNAGGAGGTSSFGAHVSCTGGAAGGAGSGTTTAAGGTATGGDVNGNGSSGGQAGTYTDSYRGYGGTAGSNQGWPTTIQDSISLNISSAGILGQWAGAGSPRPPNWDASTASFTGGTGASYGGGGSGGQRLSASAAGGAGAQGVIVVIELYY